MSGYNFAGLRESGDCANTTNTKDYKAVSNFEIHALNIEKTKFSKGIRLVGFNAPVQSLLITPTNKCIEINNRTPPIR